MMKSFLIFSILLVSLSSQAGLMIEPYVGYLTGTYNYKTIGGSKEYSDKISGTVFGGRLGYKFMLPWVAIDYMTSSGTREPDSSSGLSNQDFTQSGLAAVVGADLLGLRIFGGYGFSNTATLKGINGASDSKLKGTYTKVGLGYKFIPLVALNAEYIMNKYTKYDNGTTERDVDQVYTTLDHNMLLISLSVPFSL